jgi:hypothetical protein
MALGPGDAEYLSREKPTYSQRGDETMNCGRLIVGIALAAALASTGCATKARVTTAKACAAHGGTYNASAKTCSYTTSTRSAKQICDQQGGYYDTAADVCETGLD